MIDSQRILTSRTEVNLQPVGSGRCRITMTIKSRSSIKLLILYTTLVVTLSLSPLVFAQKKNGEQRRPIDLKDETDVGISLTLPQSEDVLVVPDEDEVRDDEDDPELDTDEDLEDLDGKRFLPIEEHIEHDSPDGEPLVSHVTAKSQTNSSTLTNSSIVATATLLENYPLEIDISWDIELFPSEEKISSTSTSTTLTHSTRKPRRKVTVPPERRHTVLPLPEAEEPPVILKQPAKEVPYKVNQPLTLECHASGEPVYTWQKDGHNVWTSLSGSMTFATANESLSGEYQCFANNSGGTAITTKVLVRQAVLSPFYSVTDPKIHRPTVGDSLTLRCSPPYSYPPGFVYWSIADEESKLKSIDNSARISLDYYGNLHFANVVANDSSGNTKYVCTVSNLFLRSLMQGDDQKIETTPGTPSPHRPQLMWSSPNGTQVVALMNETLKMKCIFAGYPTPKVTWEKVGSHGTGRIQTPEDSFGQEMTIPSIKPEDTGVYKCIGRVPDSGAEDSKEFTVTVESHPYWRADGKPKNANVSEDDSVHFSCIADGYPKPTYTWSINGIPLKDAAPDPRRTVSETQLSYVNLISSDSQVIQCFVENIHGSILANAYLIVRANAPSLAEPHPTEVKVVDGWDALLNCSVSGDPKPVITWSKSGEPIPASTDRILLHPNGSLGIKNAVLSDDGVYTCLAKNKFGEVETSCHLIVRDKTQIKIAPKSEVANAGSNITLECSVVTDPDEQSNLEVKWLKGGKPINYEQEFGRIVQNHADNSLFIRDAVVQDTASYTCEASNGLDSDGYTATVVIKDRPNPPRNVHLTSCNDPNTTLTWQSGEENNDPILEYIVYHENSVNESGLLTVPVDSPTAVFELKPWRTYRFYIRARNSLGTSSSSVSPGETCVTPETKPSKNPTGVCSEMRGFRRLVIIWNPLTSDELNGEGFHYNVSYTRHGIPGERGEWLVIKDYHTRELVVHDLEEFTPYEITVQSFNRIGTGEGKLERRIAYSSEGTPLISPQNLRMNNETLNSTSVEFQWDAVNESSKLIKGFFRGYQIQFWKTGDKDAKKVINVILKEDPDLCPLVKDERRKRRRRRRQEDAEAATTVSKVATGLWPYSQITAGVAVLNGAKVGTLGNTVTFETPEGVPGAVSNFRMTEVGSFHVKLRWNYPLNPNGILTGYEITYGVAPPHVGAVQKYPISDPTKLFAKLSHLQPDCLYNIIICAATIVGCGDPAQIQVKTFHSGSPDKPKISHETGENYVNISWSYAETATNPGSEVHVEYRKEDEGNKWKTKNPADEEDSWANVTDLVTGAEYVFAVVATNLVNKTKSDEVRVVVGSQATPPVPVVTAASSGWIIPVILVILLVLIILIIITIFFVRKENKFGQYPVLKKEKEHGNKAVQDEEKEFQEYVRRPESNHVQSRASLISDEPSDYNSGEEDSLSEYEDPLAAKFNEDGSFIGQYHKKNRDSQQGTLPTAPNTYV